MAQDQSSQFATFSKGTIIFFGLIQLVALKYLLQHLQNSGLIEVPAWIPYIDHSNCGLFKPLEYIVTSRKVVTPDGTFPAAGEPVYKPSVNLREVEPLEGNNRTPHTKITAPREARQQPV